MAKEADKAPKVRLDDEDTVCPERSMPTNAVEMAGDIAQLFGFIAGLGYESTQDQRGLLQRALAVVEWL